MKGKKTGGRTKGNPNKLTADIKAMVRAALDKAGGVKYLVDQAKANPTAFLTLVGKLIPHEVSGPDGGAIPIDVNDGRAKLAHLLARQSPGSGAIEDTGGTV